MRHKVLGANIHEAEGLLERIIALPHAQWQGDVENYNSYVPFGKSDKKNAAHKARRVNRKAAHTERRTSRQLCAQRKARR